MMMKIKYVMATACILVMATACNEKNEADAEGTFEATEVTVSNEIPGKLVMLNVNEGDQLQAGAEVGLVDTVQLYLSKLQLGKNAMSIRSNRPEVPAQIASLESQLQKQYTEKNRVTNLLKAKAATQKQLDDIEAAIQVLNGQISAMKSTLNNNTRSLDAQSGAVEVQVAQINDKLAKCHITSPVTGTVLVKYAEQGELAGTGQPLFKIADLNNVFLRVYLTAEQLGSVKLGQKVAVTTDTQAQQYDGKISWISSTSEFTPKNIQTADERQNLVYAVKISVKNDGNIKLGMYGNVKL